MTFMYIDFNLPKKAPFYEEVDNVPILFMKN